MLERSSKVKGVKLAYRGGRLVLSGRPLKGGGVATKKEHKNQELMKKYRQVVKTDEYLLPDDESLEQPYPAEAVDTVTTYTVFGTQTENQ